MQFLMYVTPVVFPMPSQGWISVLLKLNPLSSLILTTRDWLTGFSTDYLSLFFWANGILLAVSYTHLTLPTTSPV